MSENKSPLAPGSKVGHYLIRALLGRGRDAEVYRVSAPELKRDAALKIYHPIPGQITGAQFKTEMGTIAALKHPNIMRIYDFGVEGDVYYIVMELIEGTSLRDLLSAHPTGLDKDRTLLIFSQLASAVGCAHDQNVVHGNIKPDNVLLDAKRRPVLTDFNIPCLRECGDAFRSSTPAYLSPEQAKDGTAVPQSDIYTLGILLYEMVTGEVPFRGTAYEEIIAHHQTTLPRPPSRVAIGLDPRIEGAILKALSKAPTDRHESARDMLKAMENQDAAEQFQTVSVAREQVQKRRSEIKQFQQSRLDEPPAETSILPVPTDRLLWIMTGISVLAAVIIIILVIVLAL